MFEFEDSSIDTSNLEGISDQEGEEIWHSYIPNVNHLLKIMKDDPKNYINITDFFVDLDKPEEGRQLLLKNCSFFKNKIINILWGPSDGVRVEYDYFLQYWDDFLFTADESVIICDTENGDMYLQLCEEHIFVCQRTNELRVKQV